MHAAALCLRVHLLVSPPPPPGRRNCRRSPGATPCPPATRRDEPTSGLDARAAAIVMRAVKNVSLSNRTVVVTIHQASRPWAGAPRAMPCLLRFESPVDAPLDVACSLAQPYALL